MLRGIWNKFTVQMIDNNASIALSGGKTVIIWIFMLEKFILKDLKNPQLNIVWQVIIKTTNINQLCSEFKGSSVVSFSWGRGFENNPSKILKDWWFGSFKVSSYSSCWTKSGQLPFSNQKYLLFYLALIVFRFISGRIAWKIIVNKTVTFWFWFIGCPIVID